ncbi:hypothetical protein NQ317_006273 [Molorchus minor]|uniref:Uncharacterized protein n=1 Tax=Molorchus minor TaxID=1323400 RepID=A0ABQ9IPU1_9CUCU|nr:hypothetical protein NQ317_006273 [Molorchus minor]
MAHQLTLEIAEQSQQLTNAIAICDKAIESGDSQVADSALRLKPVFRDLQFGQAIVVNGNSNKQNGFDEDPFNKSNGQNSGFADDPFKNDPFKSKDDPFNAFSESNDGITSDPFGEAFSSNTSQADPFNAF